MPPYKKSGEKTREYCLKYPNVNSRQLARMLNKDFPEHFASAESARSLVRKYRGVSGNDARVRFKKSIVPYNKEEALAPFMPESLNVDTPVFKLPISIKKVLLIGDLHIPYQVNQAVEAAIDYGVKEKVDCVFLNGDLLDLHHASRFAHDPKKVSIKQEIEYGKQFFAYLRSRFKKETIYFIPGNHDVRIQRLIMQKAPELDLDDFRIDVLLRLREYDVVFLDYGSKVYFGKLMVEHGDKIRGTGGVNPARTLALKMKRHVACHHFHRTSEQITAVYDGDAFITYSVGCLTTLEPEFMPINEHNLGFAIVEMDGDEFRFHNKKIVGGKVF